MLFSRGASLFITRSSGDNSKAAGKGPRLQALETGICGIEDLAILQWK